MYFNRYFFGIQKKIDKKIILFFIIENATTATLVSLVSISVQNQSDIGTTVSLDRIICGMLIDSFFIKIKHFIYRKYR